MFALLDGHADLAAVGVVARVESEVLDLGEQGFPIIFGLVVVLIVGVGRARAPLASAAALGRYGAVLPGLDVVGGPGSLADEFAEIAFDEAHVVALVQRSTKAGDDAVQAALW